MRLAGGWLLRKIPSEIIAQLTAASIDTHWLSRLRSGLFFWCHVATQCVRRVSLASPPYFLNGLHEK